MAIKYAVFDLSERIQSINKCEGTQYTIQEIQQQYPTLTDDAHTFLLSWMRRYNRKKLTLIPIIIEAEKTRLQHLWEQCPELLKQRNKLLKRIQRFQASQPDSEYRSWQLSQLRQLTQESFWNRAERMLQAIDASVQQSNRVRRRSQRRGGLFYITKQGWHAELDYHSLSSNDLLFCAQTLLPYVDLIISLFQSLLPQSKLPSFIQHRNLLFEAYQQWLAELKTAIYQEQLSISKAMLGRLVLASNDPNLRLDDVTANTIACLKSLSITVELSLPTVWRASLTPHVFHGFNYYISKHGNNDIQAVLASLPWHCPSDTMETLSIEKLKRLVVIPKAVKSELLIERHWIWQWLQWFLGDDEFRLNFYLKRQALLRRLRAVVVDIDTINWLDELWQLKELRELQQLVQQEKEYLFDTQEGKWRAIIRCDRHNLINHHIKFFSDEGINLYHRKMIFFKGMVEECEKLVACPSLYHFEQQWTPNRWSQLLTLLDELWYELNRESVLYEIEFKYQGDLSCYGVRMQDIAKHSFESLLPVKQLDKSFPLHQEQQAMSARYLVKRLFKHEELNESQWQTLHAWIQTDNNAPDLVDASIDLLYQVSQQELFLLNKDQFKYRVDRLTAAVVIVQHFCEEDQDRQQLLSTFATQYFMQFLHAGAQLNSSQVFKDYLSHFKWLKELLVLCRQSTWIDEVLDLEQYLAEENLWQMFKIKCQAKKQAFTTYGTLNEAYLPQAILEPFTKSNMESPDVTKAWSATLFFAKPSIPAGTEALPESVAEIRPLLAKEPDMSGMFVDEVS